MASMSEKPKFRIVLVCTGVPANLGEQGASDITEEFTHRQWHQEVRCDWDGSSLILQAVNDYDEDGKALADEFSDAIAACITGGFNGEINLRSIDKFG
jgi:hypothetical protein